MNSKGYKLFSVIGNIILAIVAIYTIFALVDWKKQKDIDESIQRAESLNTATEEGWGDEWMEDYREENMPNLDRAIEDASTHWNNTVDDLITGASHAAANELVENINDEYGTDYDYYSLLAEAQAHKNSQSSITATPVSSPVPQSTPQTIQIEEYSFALGKIYEEDMNRIPNSIWVNEHFRAFPLEPNEVGHLDLEQWEEAIEDSLSFRAYNSYTHRAEIVVVYGGYDNDGVTTYPTIYYENGVMRHKLIGVLDGQLESIQNMHLEGIETYSASASDYNSGYVEITDIDGFRIPMNPDPTTYMRPIEVWLNYEGEVSRRIDNPSRDLIDETVIDLTRAVYNGSGMADSTFPIIIEIYESVDSNHGYGDKVTPLIYMESDLILQYGLLYHNGHNSMLEPYDFRQ